MKYRGEILKGILLVLIFLSILMVSCSVGPSYHAPSVDTPTDWKNLPQEKCEGFETNEEGELIYLDYWWQVFDDQKLEELEMRALENNRDLFVAFERIQEARSIAGIAASAFYPQISLNPQTTNTVELIKNYINKSSTSNTAMSSNIRGAPAQVATPARPIPFRVHELLYLLPLNLSYEVDLWGKIRDQHDAAIYNWLAKKKDYEVVMLSLTSNLAMAYYQLRAADAEADLLLKVLTTRQKAYAINKDRYEGRITFYADVTLAAEEIDIVISQYHEVIRQREVLEDQIAVLIGVPASNFSLEKLPLEDLPPCIPEGIPSEILLRRPDIAEAEYVMQSEHALVKQAYSLFFPSLTLTAAGGFESPVLKDFMKWISRYWMDGVQANQLIFDGFKTPYNLQLQIENFRQATWEYQQQVLLAFQEVEDSLSNLDSYAKQFEVALATAQWAQITNQLYLDRYLLGVTYYIDVANTERDLLNYQITVNNLRGFRYIATIQLIKALGGGWEN